MTGRRVAYVNAAAGIAGDMLLGALIDAGADPTAVMAMLGALDVDGYAVTFERTGRGGIAATWANVVTFDGDHHHDHGPPDRHHDDDNHHHAEHDEHADDHHDHHGHQHRPAHEVRRIIADADLPPRVRQRALAVVTALAEAEGLVHGIHPDDVELHEVGALDAIVDIVGVAAALEALGVDALQVSPLAMGHGTVHAAHGALPNPPPAVARLLASRRVPVIGIDTAMELSTPTGVALAVTLADGFGPLPAMTVERVGYGAGTADPTGRPNVVQVVIGQATDPDPVAPSPGRAAIQIEANVDDVTGEVIAHTIAAALAAGAHDAWAAPIVMKKGRPAYTIAALVDPASLDAVATVMVNETGTLGIRATTTQRWPQSRDVATIDLDGHTIGIKRSGTRVKVEHDDAVAAAMAMGRPLRDVLRDAETRAVEAFSRR
ncbi:MAG: nickel pincer cofactor biosynthesis protein LarC [Desertimonas sp.]